MAWTAPRTWVTAEVVTAAMMNTHVRDNLLETAPAKVTTAGDIVQATGANALARFGIGGSGFVLGSTGSALAWRSRGIEVLATTGKMAAPATVSFTPAVIDQNFSNLLIVGSARGTTVATSDNVQMRFNNDATASYDFVTHDISNSALVSAAGAFPATLVIPVTITGGGGPASVFSPFTILIPGYKNTVQPHKSYMAESTYQVAAAAVANYHRVLGQGRWANLAAITQIDLFPAGNFDTGSQITLYGIW